MKSLIKVCFHSRLISLFTMKIRVMDYLTSGQGLQEVDTLVTVLLYFYLV